MKPTETSEYEKQNGDKLWDVLDQMDRYSHQRGQDGEHDDKPDGIITEQNEEYLKIAQLADEGVITDEIKQAAEKAIHDPQAEDFREYMEYERQFDFSSIMDYLSTKQEDLNRVNEELAILDAEKDGWSEDVKKQVEMVRTILVDARSQQIFNSLIDQMDFENPDAVKRIVELERQKGELEAEISKLRPILNRIKTPYPYALSPDEISTIAGPNMDIDVFPANIRYNFNARVTKFYNRTGANKSMAAPAEFVVALALAAEEHMPPLDEDTLAGLCYTATEGQFSSKVNASYHNYDKYLRQGDFSQTIMVALRDEAPGKKILRGRRFSTRYPAKGKRYQANDPNTNYKWIYKLVDENYDESETTTTYSADGSVAEIWGGELIRRNRGSSEDASVETSTEIAQTAIGQLDATEKPETNSQKKAKRAKETANKESEAAAKKAQIDADRAKWIAEQRAKKDSQKKPLFEEVEDEEQEKNPEEKLIESVDREIENFENFKNYLVKDGEPVEAWTTKKIRADSMSKTLGTTTNLRRGKEYGIVDFPELPDDKMFEEIKKMSFSPTQWIALRLLNSFQAEFKDPSEFLDIINRRVAEKVTEQLGE